MSTTIHASPHEMRDEVACPPGPDAASASERLVAVGRLFGIATCEPAGARVLEVGCGDGADLLARAARSPHGRFVGIEASTPSLSQARAAADDLGLDNVAFVEGDVRSAVLPAGTFDIIVAHGFYSRAPREMRDAFFAFARERLSPDGLLVTSYDLLPGGHVRRIARDAARLEAAAEVDAAARPDAERRIRRDLAEAWRAAGGAAAALARVVADDDARTDAAQPPGDSPPVSDPVYFTSFVRHAAAHGLHYLAEADLGTMGAGDLSPGLQKIVAACDTLAREQYLDFARLRSLRQSVLVGSDARRRAKLSPPAIDAMHASARPGGDEGGAGGGKVAEWLATRHPASVPVPELLAELESRGVRPEDTRGVVVRACFAGAIVLRAMPAAVAAAPGERPRAFAFARWQAARCDTLTSLLHERVVVDEPDARRILMLADGTRDRDALAAALDGRGDAPVFVDRALAHFARVGLLEA